MRHRIHPARPTTNVRRSASDQRRNDNFRRLRAILFRRDRRLFSGAPAIPGRLRKIFAIGAGGSVERVRQTRTRSSSDKRSQLHFRINRNVKQAESDGRESSRLNSGAGEIERVRGKFRAPRN